MRRFLVLLAVAIPFATSTATAAEPIREAFPVDSTFRAPFTSAACGFDVFIHVEGTFKLTAHVNRQGEVVRELDFSPGLKVTFFAPSTGKSFTVTDPGIAHYVYPEGASIGSTAIIVFTGKQGSAPGVVAAGRTVLEGVVVAFDPAGIPLVDVVRDVSQTGHFPPGEDFVAARCAALAL